jgi:predicted phage terminase large subunit-like protein
LKDLQSEREKRLRARSSLLTYASSIEIPGAPIRKDDEDCEEFTPIKSAFGAHHLLWIDCLQKVEDGEIPRLMGLMPPGSAKSTYSSVVFPTHFMGRFPRSSVIVASYGSDLPRKFGRRARSIAKQPVYRRIFSTGLAADSAAADEWALENASEWMAAGILTGITGNRVDLVVWDDLIKGREQADSDVIRNKTWDAYFDDLLTRKKPMAREVGITTRWHEDDPAGRILPMKYNGESGWIKGRDGNDWYVVCLPAECERSDDPLGRKVGDYIWPEWFPPGHFEPFKRNSRTWNALFQQRPAPESGDYFKAEWLKPYEVMPSRDTLRVYGASDYAVTKDSGNYTVHVVVGIDPNDNIYLLDLWRKQASSDVWVEAFCDLVQRWRPIGWAEESGQIKSGIGPFLQKRLIERKLYVVRAPYPSRSDKSIRAQSIRGRMAMQGLYVPHLSNWFPDFKSELMVFPNGNNDDQVDAISLIGQVLDKMMPGEAAKPAPEKPKVFSTDPAHCTVTMDDMWEANSRRRGSRGLRIQ